MSTAGFVALARQLNLHRDRSADYALYERLKREFEQMNPEATPNQYAAAMRAIANAAGV